MSQHIFISAAIATYTVYGACMQCVMDISRVDRRQRIIEGDSFAG